MQVMRWGSQMEPSCHTASQMTILTLFVCAHALSPFPFNDPNLPLESRIDDLLKRMKVSEKVGMLFMEADMALGNDVIVRGENGDLPSTNISRLGVPEFNWMSGGNVYRGAPNGCNLNCCSCYDGHNMSNCCVDAHATQFPQGTGWAATFNAELAFSAGQAIAAESMALQYNLGNGGTQPPRHVDYRTGASSVINIAVHPGWGRVPETLGECPYLTSELALALNKGLMGYRGWREQDANSTVLAHGRVVILPTLRHFAAYAGPERGRFSFSASVPEPHMRYTFLPAWRRLIAAGAVGGVMSAITAVNGAPSVADARLLQGVLRDEWGYLGHVISDCDTVPAETDSFHFTSNVEEASTTALSAGGDINCGKEYAALLNASLDGLLPSETLDIAVRRVLRARFRVGDLDAPGSNSSAAIDPFFRQPLAIVDSIAHRNVRRRVVRESVVLLRNGASSAGDSSVVLHGSSSPPLPLRLASTSRFAVVGPSADDISVQAHTYHGTPSRWVSVLSALREAISGAGADPDAVIGSRVAHGCDRFGTTTSSYDAAITAARAADVAIFVGGLDQSREEEDTDRDDLTLPAVQLNLLRRLRADAPNTTLVVLIISGGAVASPELLEGWGADLAPPDAVLWSSYFGESADGIVDVLFGNYDPSGRMPFTVPRANSDVVAIGEGYDLSRGNGSTYRYLNMVAAPPLVSFGAGLSYAQAIFAPQLLVVTGNMTSAGNVTVQYGSRATIVAELQRNATGRHIAADLPLDVAVQLYGAFVDGKVGCRSAPAELPSYVPRRQLLALRKVTLRGVSATKVQLPLQVDEKGIPGLSRAPFPGWLCLWVGNAQTSSAVSSVMLRVVGKRWSSTFS